MHEIYNKPMYQDKRLSFKIFLTIQKNLYKKIF